MAAAPETREPEMSAHALRAGIDLAIRRYGETSRAVYLLKYLLAGRTLDGITSSGSSAPRWYSEQHALLDRLVADLGRHFDTVLAWDEHSSARCEVLDEQRGEVATTTRYRYDRLAYKSTLAGSQGVVSPRLVRLESPEDRFRVHGGPHLYAQSPDGAITVLDKRLTMRDLLSGTRLQGHLVKHPHLVPDHLEVLCAGDIWFSCDSVGSLAGAIVSRGSGQFRPTRDALDLVRQRLASLGVEPDSIYLIREDA